MIKIIKGDLINAKEDIIAHQVNVHGVMGAGVAYQIAKKYPDVNDYYKSYSLIKRQGELLGTVLFFKEKDITIANMFCQNQMTDEYGRLTNYEMMERCFKLLNKHGRSIAIPYKIGCGIAKGDWGVVLDIIIENCTDIDVTIYKL